VNIVSFSGQPVPIPEWQIENLRILEGTELRLKIEKKEFVPGHEVRITRGALEGLRGTIVKIRGRNKLVISINALHYHLTIDIDPVFAERVGGEE
jgi:transcription antitermination factor NusG